jgi:SAM-dependent methyltransferase
LTGYIMESDAEVDRLLKKTERVLTRRHLHWAGLHAGESFLDVGCGSVAVPAEAARINDGALVVGLDADASRVRRATADCERLGVTVCFHRAEVTGPGSSGLPDDRFDHVWSRFLLEYLPTPNAAVVEMTRVARPNGKITLIDLEGNCVRHFGMSAALRGALDEVVADLATTGFDPDVGAKLVDYARGAGLLGIRHEIEPYHRIVGRPDVATERAWKLKIDTLRENYLTRIRPDKLHLAWVFDAFMDFLRAEDTMTWSLLHLVQGSKTAH